MYLFQPWLNCTIVIMKGGLYRFMLTALKGNNSIVQEEAR